MLYAAFSLIMNDSRRSCPSVESSISQDIATREGTTVSIPDMLALCLGLPLWGGPTSIRFRMNGPVPVLSRALYCSLLILVSVLMYSYNISLWAIIYRLMII